MAVRKYEEIIRQATYQASPTEKVVAYLADRATRLKGNQFLEEGDEEFEQVLLRREDYLIKLALAQYCRFISTAKALFLSNDEALKLSVLTNQVVSSKSEWRESHYFPIGLFEGDKQAFASYIANCSEQELSALFENPSLKDSMLSEFLEGDEVWQALEESKQLEIIHILSRNPRMQTKFQGDQFIDDGWSDYEYSRVFDEAWKLSERVPRTPAWANALSSLYEKMVKSSFSIDDPMALIERWKPTTEEQIAIEKSFLNDACLNGYQGVRFALARLARPGKLSNAKLLASDDAALRCAVYADSELKIEFMQQAFEKDKELAYNYMVRNPKYWDRADARELLHQMARDVSKNAKDHEMMALSLFNGMQEKFELEHPEWFIEQEEIEESEKAVTKGDLEAFSTQIANSVGSIDGVKSLLSSINSRIGFVWWFSLGALAVSLFKH